MKDKSKKKKNKKEKKSKKKRRVDEMKLDDTASPADQDVVATVSLDANIASSPGCSWGSVFAAASQIKPAEGAEDEDFFKRNESTLVDPGLIKMSEIAASSLPKVETGPQKSDESSPAIHSLKRKHTDSYDDSLEGEPILEGRMVPHPDTDEQFMVLVDSRQSVVYSALGRTASGDYLRLGTQDSGNICWDEDAFRNGKQDIPSKMFKDACIEADAIRLTPWQALVNKRARLDCCAWNLSVWVEQGMGKMFISERDLSRRFLQHFFYEKAGVTFVLLSTEAFSIASFDNLLTRFVWIDKSEDEVPGPDSFPFPTDQDDHCESPIESYRDILPFLELLCHGKKDQLEVYDPYYCDGAVKRHLKELGFAQVHNEKQDAYGVWANNLEPDYQVLVTNPPYSDQHIPKLFEFITSQKFGNRPWFLLLPNWVHKKDFFKSATCEIRPFYLVPKKRYVYLPPKQFRDKKASDVHKKSSPFPSMWYIWGGSNEKNDELIQRYLTTNDRHCDLCRSKSALRDLRRKGQKENKT